MNSEQTSGQRVQIDGEDLLLFDDEGVNTSMRAEAATRAHVTDNWVMAALMTANGGAAIALLGQEDRSWITAAALALYMLGVTCALVGGKLSANLSHESEALFITLINQERANRHRFRAIRTGDRGIIDRAFANCEKTDKTVAEQSADFDKSSAPDPWLGFGIIFFLVGCIVAGVAIF